MSTDLILSLIADLGLIGVILWLTIVHRKLVIIARNGAKVTTAESEAIEWVRREGRFKDCEPDTPMRPQIMPGPFVNASQQTHAIGGEYHDGATENMDA